MLKSDLICKANGKSYHCMVTLESDFSESFVQTDIHLIEKKNPFPLREVREEVRWRLKSHLISFCVGGNKIFSS